MLTPQEVASHAFSKATLGGYNMAMVDEFLDLLTEDYTALYNDNAILKNKLKVLSETVEEYRATDTAMRKTLLAAQQMAESMISDAERKKNELVQDAEAMAMARMDELRRQIADEEHRLQAAKEATAAYARQVKTLHTGAIAYLDRLDELTADVNPQAAPVEVDSLAGAIISGMASDGQSAPEEEPTRVIPAMAEEEPGDPRREYVEQLDPEVTQRFENLQFGRDYEIT